ncbi:MAG TPA: hypothetical protein VF824_21680 [Thermoanaerobaculia bacterium]|jgi:hypothetical protein
MRKVWLLVGASAMLAACDPLIRRFNVTPPQLACSGEVLVSWEGTDAGGHLETSEPVTPSLPFDAPAKGSQKVLVEKTTTFVFRYPGAGHRDQTVNVADTPEVKTLTFSGGCTGAPSPTFNTVTISAADAPGKLTSITTDADWPIHVFHNGTEVALAPGAGPIFTLPDLTAAGDYTITVPGVPGEDLCKGSGGPTGGGDPPGAVPAVKVFVKGSCGK